MTTKESSQDSKPKLDYDTVDYILKIVRDKAIKLTTEISRDNSFDRGQKVGKLKAYLDLFNTLEIILKVKKETL